MSEVGFRKSSMAHNWGKAANTAGDGPGRRNQYFATPSGVAAPTDSSFLGDVGGPIAPRHQPFNPANIVSVNLGDLLKEQE
jgi:hypothetical protein